MHGFAAASLFAGALFMTGATADPAPAPVAAEGRVERTIARLLAAPHADPAWFAPSFLAKVPPAALDRPLRALTEGMGSLRAVVASATGYRADYERGSIDVDAKLDDAGRFTGLFLHPPQPLPRSVDEAMKAFAALPGEVSVATVVDGKPGVGLAPDEPLAVGSSFKLAVLAALRARVAAGAIHWADVVTLDERWRSLPSGALQDWPVGTHLTIETLAAAMISISDNTAADALAAIVGRSELERRVPVRAHPFLTTREAFVLKSPAQASLLARWRKADLEGRRKMLAELDAQPLPRWWDPDGPAALDVEWLLTTRELCGLMAEVQDLPLMTINPGVGKLTPGDRIAFKGGSESGVINLTVAVDRGAHHVCLSATWNDANEVDSLKMVVAARGLLGALLR